jgi:hypothetical protein
VFDAIPWQVFVFIITGIVGAYTFITKRISAQRDQVADLEQSHARLSERVAHMPNAEAVTRLTVAVAELTTEIRGLRTSVNAVERRLDLHDEWEFRKEAKTS